MGESEFSVKAFFAEREVCLSSSHAESFYSDLASVLNNAKTYVHGHMGVQKRDDEEFDKLVPLSTNRVLFCRGQANEAWGLSSSLYRLIQSSLPPDDRPCKLEDAAVSVERRIIEVAYANGLIRNLSALELMAVLQHHGVPTRLLDVTTDWRAALYFACESLEAVDGRLFLISITPSSWGSFPRMKEGSRDLVWWDKEELNGRLDRWNEKVWPVLLPFVDARMIAQQGYYLVGGMNLNRGKQQYHCTLNGVSKPLNNMNIRKVSSLSIFFPKGRGVKGKSLDERLKELLSEKDGTWYSACISVKIPAEFKAGLLECLRKDGVYSDSIFPPVSETERLLFYIAKEAVDLRAKAIEGGSSCERCERDRVEGTLSR